MRRIDVANEPRGRAYRAARALDKVAGLQARTATLDRRGIRALLRSEHADWIVLTLSPTGELPPEAASFIQAQPSVGIVGIAGDGGCVKLQRNGFISETMWDLSLHELAVFLRSDGPGHLHGEAA